MSPQNEESFDHGASTGVTDPALRTLLEDHWTGLMERYPTWASHLGDRQFDDRLPGARPQDHAAALREDAALLNRAASLDPESLGPPDRLTLCLFREELESNVSLSAHRMEEWSLLPRDNPLTLIGWLADLRPLEDDRDVAALLSRYCALPASIEGDIETLSVGAAAGRFTNAESARRVVEMVRTELAKPVAESAAVSAVTFAEAALEATRDELAAVVSSLVRPALARYADFVERELLPHGRQGGEVGLATMEGGAECYEALIRRHTSLPLSAEEIHRVGLAELEGIHAEFEELGERVFGTRNRAEIFRRLRTDPELYFGTAEEVEAKAVSALAAAREATPDWFGRLPRADCVVKRIPEHEAPYTTVAYYQPPPADHSRPGTYRINVHAPETRPRHEAEVLAFHESIPGHHLQIAIALELPELPAFRRRAGITSYVEGWALYTERLAEEMGLYTGDTDLLGMLSFDTWRAARLVVDTGVHTMGWSRERAVEFMAGATPLAENNITNEVDRYISWPGQALSYKLGQLEIRKLRRQAEAELGDRFDIRGFHDVVLGSGPVPMGVLGGLVRDWIGER